MNLKFADIIQCINHKSIIHLIYEYEGFDKIGTIDSFSCNELWKILFYAKLDSISVKDNMFEIKLTK